MLPHGNPFVVRWSHSQDGGAGAQVLVGKCRKVDSWLEGNVLGLLIPLFLGEIQTCCSLKQFHHLADHLLSHPPLPVFILSLPIVSLSFPFCSHLSLSLSAFYCRLALPPLCPIIYFLLSIRSILKAKVKPKSGLEPRHHFLNWQVLVIGYGLQLYRSLLRPGAKSTRPQHKTKRLNFCSFQKGCE